jgi:predicted acylesterase/phospholipase RssA
MQDQDDFHSLRRFLTGQAIGLVAGGGGAFGLCHIGIFKAFQEAGVAFDIFGGSSAGSIMAAGFACLTETEVFKSAMHDIFVRRVTTPLAIFARGVRMLSTLRDAHSAALRCQDMAYSIIGL